ncbi:MAG: hypothetical protein EXX96DRAFT_556227 [Benjaminiella poitrasii]|nr:MAG: hypothetical protein EXX96DRAFT_556227 [Benjaminiella poitrasii]
MQINRIFSSFFHKNNMQKTIDNNHILCCCSRPECPQLQLFNESFRKIEYDASLAAEIGQILLQEKNNDEEASIIEYNSFKDMLRELNQIRTENKQSKKMIELLQIEIYSLKAHSLKMENKADSYKKVIERDRLSVQQALSSKTNFEEELRTQILDLKQELSQLQKSESNIRSKHKRLGSSYEALKLSHDALLKEHDVLVHSLSKIMSPAAVINRKRSQGVSNT